VPTTRARLTTVVTPASASGRISASPELSLGLGKNLCLARAQPRPREESPPRPSSASASRGISASPELSLDPGRNLRLIQADLGPTVPTGKYGTTFFSRSHVDKQDNYRSNKTGVTSIYSTPSNDEPGRAPMLPTDPWLSAWSKISCTVRRNLPRY
jgi:hypothetical protein